MYKHQSTTQVNPLHYDSVQDVTTSDHKPVWGMWEVKIRPGKGNFFSKACLKTFFKNIFLLTFKWVENFYSFRFQKKFDVALTLSEYRVRGHSQITLDT